MLLCGVFWVSVEFPWFLVKNVLKALKPPSSLMPSAVKRESKICCGVFGAKKRLNGCKVLIGNLLESCLAVITSADT
jgi:hypothetical protein